MRPIPGNDGSYIYFVPNNAGEDRHGEVLRFFTGHEDPLPASIEGGSTF